MELESAGFGGEAVVAVAVAAVECYQLKYLQTVAVSVVVALLPQF